MERQDVCKALRGHSLLHAHRFALRIQKRRYWPYPFPAMRFKLFERQVTWRYDEAFNHCRETAVRKRTWTPAMLQCPRSELRPESIAECRENLLVSGFLD